MKKNRVTKELEPDIRERVTKSTKMAEVSDARELISEYNTPIENLYANYANGLKDLARQARRDILDTGNIAYSREAREKYKGEVTSIEAQLDEALRNKPKERKAQFIANAAVKAIKAQHKSRC